VRLYRGMYADAEAGFREALDACRRVRGAENEQTLSISLNLAFVLSRLGKLDAAESLVGLCLSVQQRVLGDDDIPKLDTPGRRDPYRHL